MNFIRVRTCLDTKNIQIDGFPPLTQILFYVKRIFADHQLLLDFTA